MYFGFTEDQQSLQTAIGSLLEDRCTPELVRGVAGGNRREGTSLWNRLSDMGLPLGMVKESSGGMGLDEVDMTGIAEKIGRRLVPLPIIETMAVVAPLLESAGELELLRRLLDGTARATTSLDGTRMLAYPDADFALVRVEHRIHVFEDLSRNVHLGNAIDHSRPVGYLKTLGGSRELAVSTKLQDLAWLRGVQATSACLVGIVDHMLKMTVDYVSVRHQFGRPVGSFQAVKHRLANVAIRLELTRSMVYAAGWALASGESSREQDVVAGKAMASEMALEAAQACLLSHGGIGYTTEYDLSLWMKRAWALASAWGDASSHRRRLSALLDV